MHTPSQAVLQAAAPCKRMPALPRAGSVLMRCLHAMRVLGNMKGMLQEEERTQVC